MAMTGVEREERAAFDAQPRAVLPAQRRNRQSWDNRVTHRRLEVDEVVLDDRRGILLVIYFHIHATASRVLWRVDEQFLNVRELIP